MACNSETMWMRRRQEENVAVSVQIGHFLARQEPVDEPHAAGFENAMVVGVEGRQGGAQRQAQLRVAFAQDGESLQNIQAASHEKVLRDLTPGVDEEQMDLIGVPILAALPAGGELTPSGV